MKYMSENGVTCPNRSCQIELETLMPTWLEVFTQYFVIQDW